MADNTSQATEPPETWRRRELLARGLLLGSATLPLSLLSACNSSSSSSAPAATPTTAPATPASPAAAVPALNATADANGLYLPPGYSSRVIASAGQTIADTGFMAPQIFSPDGAHCFADPEVPGGWIHIINSEVPLVGGAIAIRYQADGHITDAYRVLSNTSLNCAGGPTPWGTWISCEEIDTGTSWETHPLGEGVIDGVQYPVRLDSLGLFKHEAAAVDPANKMVYLTEDQTDGCLYRLVGSDPYPWDGSVRGDLTQGTLQVAVVILAGQALKDTGELQAGSNPLLSVNWVDLPNPGGGALDPTRSQVAEATVFNGGEGCWFHKGSVFFTTKGDDRVWQYRVADASLSIFYDDNRFGEPVLTGVDNIIVDSQDDHILVAEDGGNLEVVVITPEFNIGPLARLSEDGNAGSEVTGLALNPSRTRLYFNSQRGGPFPVPATPLGSGGGVVYEIRRDDGRPILNF